MEGAPTTARRQQCLRCHRWPPELSAEPPAQQWACAWGEPAAGSGAALAAGQEHLEGEGWLGVLLVQEEVGPGETEESPCTDADVNAYGAGSGGGGPGVGRGFI